MVLSEYELQRNATIAQNRAHMRALGLEEAALPPTRTRAPPKRERGEATRASLRVRSARPQYTGEVIDAFGDDEPRLQRSLLSGHDAPPQPEVAAAVSGAVAPAAARMRAPKPRARVPSAVVEGVRAFVEEHVPDEWQLEEREMFGMAIWMVRGNMFLGIGLRSERLLVRVGEAQVEATLAQGERGVSRCSAASGRTFSGTLMVDLEQFRGAALLRRWFELAMAHNRTLKAKAPSDKPRKRSKEEQQQGGEEAAEAAAEEAAEAKEEEPAQSPREEAEDDEAAAAARRRPPSTSSAAFARCVRHVITRIPRGKVAAYGQVAALAGAPGNARQVGRLLADGLCYGGAPWHRVLGAAGKISLPAAAGGERQRALLEAEGVVFREHGAVERGTFWARNVPFFAA